MRITHRHTTNIHLQSYQLNGSVYKNRPPRKSFAPSKTRLAPLVVNFYVPDESGELVLTKRVRPKAK